MNFPPLLPPPIQRNYRSSQKHQPSWKFEGKFLQMGTPRPYPMLFTNITTNKSPIFALFGFE